jgi:hypothetical protein
VQKYRRDDIKAPAFRIKEWDYYLVVNKDFAAAFTISDDGYIGLQSVSLLVFGDQPWEHTETVLNPFPMGSLRLPEDSSYGTTKFSDKRLQMKFEAKYGARFIKCDFDNFMDGKPLKAEIRLEQPPMDSMVIATPWKENRRAFYYNQKITCMKAKGSVTVKGRTYTFDDSKDYGILDWGRGVWTYNNTWFWGVGSGTVNGKPFGYNIGYGFGDTSAASENMLFYDGKCHKLDLVDFCIPENVMDTWNMTSSDNRFRMQFTPFFNDRTDISVGIMSQHADKLFGMLNGVAVLDDGTELKIENMPVFHERVHNKW